VSNFIGPVLAGLVIDYAGVWMGGAAGDTNGFRAAFALLAVFPLMTWFWIRHAQELPPAPVQPGTALRQVLDLLKQRQMRRLLVVNWLLASCWDVHTFVVPVLGHERAYSASVIGTVLGSFAIAAACVRLLMPLVAAHLREWVVLSVAMAVTAAVFLVYPLMPSAWAMGLCSVVLGLALGSVQPMVMSTLHQITPHAQHGQALGLRLMSINLSSVVMPVLFGTAAGTVVGVTMVFWTVGAAVGLGAHLAWKIRP
jgi:predicted MFS family arabinose efflux permease